MLRPWRASKTEVTELPTLSSAHVTFRSVVCTGPRNGSAPYLKWRFHRDAPFSFVDSAATDRDTPHGRTLGFDHARLPHTNIVLAGRELLDYGAAVHARFGEVRRVGHIDVAHHRIVNVAAE